MSIILQQQNSIRGLTHFPWSTTEVAILRRMYERGMPQRKIAQRLKRTVDSVQKALVRFEIRKKGRHIKQTKLFVCSVCKARRYVPVNENVPTVEA